LTLCCCKLIAQAHWRDRAKRGATSPMIFSAQDPRGQREAKTGTQAPFYIVYGAWMWAFAKESPPLHARARGPCNEGDSTHAKISAASPSIDNQGHRHPGTIYTIWRNKSLVIADISKICASFTCSIFKIAHRAMVFFASPCHIMGPQQPPGQSRAWTRLVIISECLPESTSDVIRSPGDRKPGCNDYLLQK